MCLSHVMFLSLSFSLPFPLSNNTYIFKKDENIDEAQKERMCDVLKVSVAASLQSDSTVAFLPLAGRLGVL